LITCSYTEDTSVTKHSLLSIFAYPSHHVTQNVAVTWKQDFSKVIPKARALIKTHSSLGLNTCIPNIRAFMAAGL